VTQPDLIRARIDERYAPWNATKDLFPENKPRTIGPDRGPLKSLKPLALPHHRAELVMIAAANSQGRRQVVEQSTDLINLSPKIRVTPPPDQITGKTDEVEGGSVGAEPRIPAEIGV
jgi:hypothetical protein